MKPLPLPRFLADRVGFVVWTLRLLVGATFVVSGLAKLIDEWGFVLKIEQYLAVWDFSMPRTLVLAAGVFLSGIEFVAGSLLLVGCYRRVTSWLVGAIMLFMLPLTLYIMIANPVSDCGCFGDLWKISNTATFIKNVFLTAGVLYLISYNHKVKGLFMPYVQWAVMAVLGVYALAVSLIGYNVQPMIDFRPYPVGLPLVAETDEEANVVFLYEKDGVTQEFSVEALPDSTWIYVDRKESVGEKLKTFAIFEEDDDEVTSDVISTDGEQLLVMIPDLRRADVAYTYLINELNSYMKGRDGSLIAVIATTPKGIERWIDFSMAEYPCYTAEDTTIKEVARGNVALVYLKDGIIQWKRNFYTIPTNILSAASDPLEELRFDGDRLFLALTGAMIAMLLLLGIFQDLMWSTYHRVRLHSSQNE